MSSVLDNTLDCGYQDGMVSYKDTEATAKYLESRHANVVWELRDGGHNSAFYMAGMLKSMKMHSLHFQRNGAAFRAGHMSPGASFLLPSQVTCTLG